MRLEAEELERLLESKSPVHAVAVKGECFGFVATAGAELEERVAEILAHHDFLGAVLLDAAASQLVEALVDMIQTQCCEGPSERFSPGYCNWGLRAQIPLLALMQAESVGITLLDSLLMRPLKSVSGIVVEGPADALRVDEKHCSQCPERGCKRRRAPPPSADR